LTRGTQSQSAVLSSAPLYLYIPTLLRCLSIALPLVTKAKPRVSKFSLPSPGIRRSPENEEPGDLTLFQCCICLHYVLQYRRLSRISGISLTILSKQKRL
ncbi:hypothetical protein PanWU01x14_194890, partial [Parasponia andersonii]